MVRQPRNNKGKGVGSPVELDQPSPDFTAEPAFAELADPEFAAVELDAQIPDVDDSETPELADAEATPATVAEMCQLIKNIPLSPDVAFVFDVFGNSTTCYELYDGTTSLPVKLGGVSPSGRDRQLHRNRFQEIV